MFEKGLWGRRNTDPAAQSGAVDRVNTHPSALLEDMEYTKADPWHQSHGPQKTCMWMAITEKVVSLKYTLSSVVSATAS